MADDGTGGPVLVGLDDPAHVQQLVRTAGDLARLGDGTVRLVTVVVKPHDSPFGLFDDETIVREYGGDSRELVERADAPADVTVERDVVVARSPTRGLLKAVEKTDPSALLVGWRERSRRSDAVLGTTVDALVERAECDLYVERVGREADGVDSVLLPVAGGPHVDVAAMMAAAIAVRNDARVVVFSVADADTDVAAATEFAEEGHRTLATVSGVEPAVETVVREAANPTDAVGEEAANHDVVVLGATRRGALRRRLVGSVARRIVRRTDETIILARDGAVVGGPIHRLGELLRR
ncbi:universal stress protein [Halopelagius longus]|uniref:Universal stress protein n=1 Tax=Halopelagius longus TaxID=1236180 RepID=A0A1H1DUJ0_9EURY|nr:universal stress protein [Halopelagius longus]RDI71476.1 universal stress protein [Halopelagius longus]SDQ80222.1 Nucleotide-binding universal stress protein, UspA family [Halopelagius longus]